MPILPTIITTSWDDGHPHDQRMAELLSRYGIRGTFYVPGSFNGHPTLGASTLRAMETLGHECGSHTMHHVRLDRLPDLAIVQEVQDGKQWLEDQIGHSPKAFCYPEGSAPHAARRAVRQAGFLVGRTTRSLRMDTRFDPILMPVTFQMYAHGRYAHFRHAVREGNWVGLMQWLHTFGGGASIDEMVDTTISYIISHGGLLHIWGHSWEIDSLGWWDRLEGFLQRIARLPGVSYLCNTDAALAFRPNEN